MQAHGTVTTTELLRITLQQIGRYSGRILSVMGLIWLLQMPSYFSERLLLPLDAMAMLGLPPGPVSLAAGSIVMLNFLPSVLVGTIAALLLALNVVLWVSTLFVFAIPVG